MRGADEQINTMSDLYDRFIPTCVGQTNDALMLSIVVPGSSPHAWGRHALEKIIDGLNSVHPHMRGADSISTDRRLRIRRFIPTCVGQTGRVKLPAADVGRFIPTCVGQTFVQIEFHALTPVHPHMRGADLHAQPMLIDPQRFIPTCVGQTAMSPSKSYQSTGSSPHAWGRRWFGLSKRSLRPVHPHMRGADACPH